MVRAAPPSGRRRRWLAVLVLGCVVAVAGTGATAQSTKEQLEDAKRRLERLKTEITDQQAVLDRLSDQASAMASQVEVAEGRFEKSALELKRTNDRIAVVQGELDALRAQLGERMRSAYIQGPGTDLEYILAATSLADLADRMTFVDAIAQADVDLATEVEAKADELAAKAAVQEDQKRRSREAYDALQSTQDELFRKLARQQSILDDIESKMKKARDLVEELGKKYQDELDQLNGVTTGDVDTSGVFKVCPVDQPRAMSDGFGAPRYGGGYHPHAGVDLMAPTGTPIRAPFDGTARTSYNTLGGNAVYVTGSQGYVYNAHLSAYSDRSTGPVQAGDIIGYVGATGDASGPHNHFEWHPNVVPSDWTVSPYGYAVIGGAVNPWPLLQKVC